MTVYQWLPREEGLVQVEVEVRDDKEAKETLGGCKYLLSWLSGYAPNLDCHDGFTKYIYAKNYSIML